MTIRPQPAANMSGMIARVHKNGPLRLMAMRPSLYLFGDRLKGAKGESAALFTSTVMGPSSARVARGRRGNIHGRSRIPHTSNRAARRVSDQLSGLLHAVPLQIPDRNRRAVPASRMAIARPKPRAAPVTTAVLPFSDMFPCTPALMRGIYDRHSCTLVLL